MKNSRETIFLIIPYFTVCSVIYHWTFWDAFSINGLAYIQVADLIKSFIQPFLSFGSFIFLGMILMHVIIYFASRAAFFEDQYSSEWNVWLPIGGGHESSIGKKLNSHIGIFILIIAWLLMCLFLYCCEHSSRWVFWSYFFSIVPHLSLYRIGFLSSLISNNSMRQAVIQILIYIPVFSFAAGKKDSELIYRNVQFKYTLHDELFAEKDLGSLYPVKFIGISGGFIFTSSFDNKVITMTSIDKISRIRLYDYSSEK